MMRVETFLLTILEGFLLLTSCGLPKHLGIAEKSVGQFHADLNSERYSTIYNAAEDGLHKVTTEADFTHLLRSVHQKLGMVDHFNLLNFEDGYFTGQGRVVTLLCDTTFAAGVGTEQFVFHFRGNQLALFGYHITSTALIEK
jgi:hypothetical protein